MSIAIYDLRLKASYDAGVAFDLQRFRDLLKAERKTRVGARETLADRAGLNKSTVQNAEVGPDIPGIDTVASLIEAMPGLTLSLFFVQLEENPRSSLKSLASSAQDALSTPEVADAAEPESAEDPYVQQFAALLVKYVREELAHSDRAAPSPRAEASKSRRRVRRRHRKSP